VTLIFNPLAEREFIAAARFYELAPWLGCGLYSTGRTHPERDCGSSKQPVREEHDQAPPYSEISIRHRVEVESANISVIAVMHLRRRLGYWQRRRRSGSPLSRPSFKIGFFESPPLFFASILMTDKFC
jgi:hypothetical protein